MKQKSKIGRVLFRLLDSEPGSVLDLTGTSGPAVVFVTAAVLPLGLVVTVKQAGFNANIRCRNFKLKALPAVHFRLNFLMEIQFKTGIRTVHE